MSFHSTEQNSTGQYSAQHNLKHVCFPDLRMCSRTQLFHTYYLGNIPSIYLARSLGKIKRVLNNVKLLQLLQMNRPPHPHKMETIAPPHPPKTSSGRRKIKRLQSFMFPAVTTTAYHTKRTPCPGHSGGFGFAHTSHPRQRTKPEHNPGTGHCPRASGGGRRCAGPRPRPLCGAGPMGKTRVKGQAQAMSALTPGALGLIPSSATRTGTDDPDTRGRPRRPSRRPATGDRPIAPRPAALAQPALAPGSAAGT